jgi:hypothetical protein
MSTSPTSALPFVAQTFSLIADTVTEVPIAPYSNTKEIVILNLSEADPVYVRIVALTEQPATLPASLTATTSLVVPASGSVTLCVGAEGERNAIRTLANWNAQVGGSCFVLAFFSPGDAGEVNVTYINTVGGPA